MRCTYFHVKGHIYRTICGICRCAVLDTQLSYYKFFRSMCNLIKQGLRCLSGLSTKQKVGGSALSSSCPHVRVSFSNTDSHVCRKKHCVSNCEKHFEWLLGLEEVRYNNADNKSCMAKKTVSVRQVWI